MHSEAEGGQARGLACVRHKRLALVSWGAFHPLCAPSLDVQTHKLGKEVTEASRHDAAASEARQTGKTLQQCAIRSCSARVQTTSGTARTAGRELCCNRECRPGALRSAASSSIRDSAPIASAQSSVPETSAAILISSRAHLLFCRCLQAAHGTQSRSRSLLASSWSRCVQHFWVSLPPTARQPLWQRPDSSLRCALVRCLQNPKTLIITVAEIKPESSASRTEIRVVRDLSCPCRQLNTNTIAENTLPVLLGLSA